jgi:phosphoribosylanthranilate isomerase|uniref:N-(5'-phosphoribosyl)anthranilate isomerase n=1 Tax=Desulfobacca acetoxidans TaxID=60893 RepID=A0A7C3Z0M7_9BACT
MVRIKICGITNLEDARLAADLGAHALGFIFYPKSPRSVRPEEAREIIRNLPPLVMTVGVFVDEEAGTVREIAETAGLDWVQLHGRESPGYCRFLQRRVIKGFRIKDASSLSLLPDYRGAVQAYLLDTYKAGTAGGTGETFDWDLARQAGEWGPVILAGGLTPANVARAISVAQPGAVDVASGVEVAPGKKDPEKLRAFFEAIKEVGGGAIT